MEAQASRLPISGLLDFWKTQETSFHSCADSQSSHLNRSSASVDRRSISSSGKDGGNGLLGKACDGTSSSNNNNNGAMADLQNTSTESRGSSKSNISINSHADSVSIKASNTSFSKTTTSTSSGNNQSLSTSHASCDLNVSQTCTQRTENCDMERNAISINQSIGSTGAMKNQVTSTSTKRQTETAEKQCNDWSIDRSTGGINHVDRACTNTNGSWSVNSISSSQSMEDRLDDLHAAAAEVVRRHAEDEKKVDDEDVQKSHETAPNTSSDCYNIDSPDKQRHQGSEQRKNCNTPKNWNQQYHRQTTPSTVAETPSPSSKDLRVTFDVLEHNGDSGCQVVNRSFADRFPCELDSSPPELDLTSIHSDGASTQHHISVEDLGIDQLNVSQDSLEHSIGHNSSIDLNRSGDTERMMARVVSAAGAALSQEDPEKCYQQEGFHFGFERQRQHMQKQHMRSKYPYTPARLHAEKTGINVNCNIVTPGKPGVSQKQLEAIARGTTPRRSNQQEIMLQQEHFDGRHNGVKSQMSYNIKPLKSSAQHQRDLSCPEMQQTAVSFDSDHDSLSFSTGGHSVDTADDTAPNFLMNALLDLMRPLEEDPLENTDDYSLFSDDGSSTIDTRGSISFQKSRENILGSNTVEQTARTANTSNFHSASIREASLAKLQEWWQLEILKGIATDEENNGGNEGAPGNDTPELSFSLYNLEKILLMEFQKMSFEDSDEKRSRQSFESIKRDWLTAVMTVTESAQGDALCGADERLDGLKQKESSKSTAQLETLKKLISRFQKRTIVNSKGPRSKKQSVDRSSESHGAAFEIDLDGNPRQICGTSKTSHDMLAHEFCTEPPIKNSETETTTRQPSHLQSSDIASSMRAEIVCAPLLDDEISEDFRSPDNSLIQCTSSRENSLLHHSATSNSSRRVTSFMGEDSVTRDASEKEVSAGREQVFPSAILVSVNGVKLSTEQMTSDGLLGNAAHLSGPDKGSVGMKTELTVTSHFDSVARSADVQYSKNFQLPRTTTNDKNVDPVHYEDSKPEFHESIYADPPLSDNPLVQSKDSESTSPPFMVSCANAADHTNNDGYSMSPSHFPVGMEASMAANVAFPGVKSSCPLLNATVHSNKRRSPRIRITTLRGDGAKCEYASTRAQSSAPWPETNPSPAHAKDSSPDHEQPKETAENGMLLLEVQECSSSVPSGGESDKRLTRTVPQQHRKFASPPNVLETDLSYLGSELVLQDSSTQEDIYLMPDQPDEVWQDLLDARNIAFPLNNSRLSHFGEECILSEHSESEVLSLDGDTAETASPNNFICNKSPGLLVSQSSSEIKPIALTTAPERPENLREETDGTPPAPPTLPPKLNRRIVESLFNMQSEAWEDFGSSSSKHFTPKKADIGEIVFPDSLAETILACSTKSCDHPDNFTKHDSEKSLPKGESALSELRTVKKKMFGRTSKIRNDSDNPYMNASYIQFAAGLKQLPVHARSAGDNVYVEFVEQTSSSEQKQQETETPIVSLVTDSCQSEDKGQNGLKKSRTSKLLASVGKRNLRKARQSPKFAPQSGKLARVQSSSEQAAEQASCTSSQSDKLLMHASLVRSCANANSLSPKNPSVSSTATTVEGKLNGFYAALEDLNESWTDFSGFGRAMFYFGHSNHSRLDSSVSVASDNRPRRGKTECFAREAQDAPSSRSCASSAPSVGELSACNHVSLGRMASSTQGESSTDLVSTRSDAAPSPSQCASFCSSVSPSKKSTTLSQQSLSRNLLSTAPSKLPLISNSSSTSIASLGSIRSQRKSTTNAPSKELASISLLSAEHVSVKPRLSLDEACKQEIAGFEPNNSSEWEDFSGSAVFDVFEPTKFVATSKKQKTKSHTVKNGRASRLIHI